MTKKHLSPKRYYRIETVRILLFPVLLLLTTWLFISQGWVKAEDAPVVWAIVGISTVANLAAILLVYVFDR